MRNWKRTEQRPLACVHDYYRMTLQIESTELMTFFSLLFLLKLCRVKKKYSPVIVCSLFDCFFFCSQFALSALLNFSSLTQAWIHYEDARAGNRYLRSLRYICMHARHRRTRNHRRLSLRASHRILDRERFNNVTRYNFLRLFFFSVSLHHQKFGACYF